MSKIILSLFLTTLFLFAVSCNRQKSKTVTLVKKNGLLFQINSTKPYTGREVAKINDKTIEYDVVKGMKTGEFKIFYNNGNLQMAGKMLNNQNVGLWKYYYPDSQLESEGKFNNDLPEGKWLWYYSNGVIKEKGFYAAGKKDGEWILFNKSGSIIKKFHFNKDVEKKDSVK